jgi:hypothetical protein
LQKLTSEILGFISKNSKIIIAENPDDFPNSLFEYLFLPEKNLVLHCVTLNIAVNNATFFQNLSNEFTQKSLKLIHIWEDVWQSKQEIVKSRIFSLLGKSETIPARLTQIRRINKPMLDKFLIVNHLQGTVGAKLKYGLFLPKKYFRILDFNKHQISANLEEILVAVASFSNAKKIIRDGQEFRSYELIRFANLTNFTVVGGLNKLLKNFIDEQNPDDIMTYADSDWSDGKNYEKIGFERIEQTFPLTFELDNQTLTRKLSTYNGFPNPSFFDARSKIYNSGNWKFLMNLKDGK